MAKLTIIVGIAGSGKTTLCREIARVSGINAFEDATLTDNNDHKRAGFDCLGEIVARLLGRNENCVMEEGHLCSPGFRENFISFCNKFLKNVELEWIFYENDLLACINNVYHDWMKKNRKDVGRLRALINQNRVYMPPSETECPGRQIRKVECDNPRKFDNETDAVLWLLSSIASRS
jgi:hypothetical protein